MCQILAKPQGPSENVLSALQDLDVRADVVRVTHKVDPVTLRRVCVSPSPTFSAAINLHNGTGSITEKCVVDSGCTGEMIISEEFANKIGAKVQHSVVRTAKLADGTASMTILGETTISGKYRGNNLELNAPCL